MDIHRVYGQFGAHGIIWKRSRGASWRKAEEKNQWLSPSGTKIIIRLPTPHAFGAAGQAQQAAERAPHRQKRISNTAHTNVQLIFLRVVPSTKKKKTCIVVAYCLRSFSADRIQCRARVGRVYILVYIMLCEQYFALSLGRRKSYVWWAPRGLAREEYGQEGCVLVGDREENEGRDTWLCWVWDMCGKMGTIAVSNMDGEPAHNGSSNIA
jgi:hypothetical protein